MMKKQINYSGIFRFIVESFIGFALVLGPILWMEAGDFFKSSEGDHNHHRWQALKSFKDSIDVDVLILGNSHAFTGINPKQLSSSLGMTSFVLANNGTAAKVAYWNLKEALELCSPKLILLETSLLNHKQTKTEDVATLISSIRAENAKANPKFKFASTWDVFTLDEIIYPWSKVLLNHHLLIESPDRILLNIMADLVKVPETVKIIGSQEKLFLGRHVKYNAGISDADLMEYDSLGPVVSAETAVISEENGLCAEAIIDLARASGAKIGFVALPLFDMHMPTSIASSRSDALERIAQMHAVPFLNLQDHLMAASPEYFQATRHYNQHMTLIGSMKASQLISDWVDTEFMDEFYRPGREGDADWHRLFEAEEGYLSYFPARQENPSVRYLLRNVMTPQMKVEEIVVFEVNNTLRENLDCFIKIRPAEIREQRLKNEFLELDMLVKGEENTPKRILVKLQRDTLLTSDDFWIFRSPLPKVEVQQLLALKML
jgi:hypothetical protein